MTATNPYRDASQRRALMALFEDGFPRLPAGIERARREGFAWEDGTQPFVVWEGEEAVGHVGVLEHRVRLDGRDVSTAGIHAVVTRSGHHRRGIARRLLEEALSWIDERYAIAKLGTDLPEVYAPHGFRPLALHRFAVEHRGGEGRGRPLAAAERARFLATCAERDPVSHRFASLDPGWLLGIDLALQRRSLADLVVLEELDAVVDWELHGTTLRVHDVIARELPPLTDVLRLAPPHERVELCFCPDRMAPAARAVPTPEAGVWMVRGDWPLEPSVPFAVSRLAEH